VVYHDVNFGNLHVSQDEGRSWVRAEDIPYGQAAMFADHPFDNRVVSTRRPSIYVRAPTDLPLNLTNSPGIRINQWQYTLPNGRPRKDLALIRRPGTSSLRPKTTLLPLRSQQI